MLAKFLVPFLVLAAGCAVKPADKIAHGEDHNLISKEALLGHPLADVASSERRESGVPMAKAGLPVRVAALTAKIASDATVVFDITESYVTVSTVTEGAPKPVLQFAVKGHYDMTNKADAAGVESQYLGKDDTAHARWQDRAYVEVDAAAPLLIKADEETLRNLYAVDTLRDATFVFHSAADLPWLSPADRVEVIKTFGLTDGQKIATTLSRGFLTVLKLDADGTRTAMVQTSVTYFDLARKENDKQEATPELVRDQKQADWTVRAFVAVDPESAVVIKADEETLRNLYTVESLKNTTFVFHSAADLPWLSPEDRVEVVETFGLKNGQKLATTLSRRFLTILKLEPDGNKTVMAQASVTYFDLARKRNDKQEMTPDVVRDQKQADWNARAFVAVDPESAVLAKSNANLMENLYDKAIFSGKTVKIGDAKAPLLSETIDLAGLIAQSAVSLTMNDEVTYRVTEKAVYVLKGKDVVMKYTVLSHVDIAPVVNDFGETTAVLKQNTANRPWMLRQYVAVDARDAEVALLDPAIVENRVAMLKREDVEGKCFALADLPLKTIIADVRAEMKTGEENAKVCLEVSQTVVSIWLDILGQRRLIMTYDVDANYDIAQVVSADGKEVATAFTKSTANPYWNERAYLDVAVWAPHAVKDEVDVNTMTKAMLDGEFLYTAVVTAAHSENGLVFTGWQLQSPDRLKFEVDAATVTAYKVNEKLNDSAAKSPVLRYSATTFDAQRARNSYGDETYVIEENRDKPWQQRKNVRVDFASNQIASYFNDLLGLEKLYYGIVFSAQSKLVGDVKIEDDMISFDTEEVITPNLAAGFSGDGESHYEPVAVKIHHAFLRLGKRSYAAKDYQAIDFAKFGFFETTEAGLDPILGKTDDSLKHFMRRFDIADGKHINYALSPNFPEKYKVVARKVVGAWNVAFKAATGRDDVMLLDESGSKAVDDPRVSMMVLVDQRHTSEPLGYGPTFFDPTTGENISGKAYIYKASIQIVLNMAGDYYDLATGARTVGDFSTATTMRGADAAAVNSRLVSFSPLARALPKTRAEAQRFTRAAPMPFKLADTVSKLRSQANLAPSALRSEATAVFGDMADEFKVKAAAANRITAQDRFQGCAITPEAHIVSAVKFIQAHPGMSKAEVLAALEESMLFSLLLHEVGHTLGLRHNFQGSFDEDSFSPKYFEAKATEGWTEQYRTSSTMDYLDDFEATDLAAGSYDVAAIKFGYGDKLEKVIGRDDFGAMVTEDMPKAEFDAAVEALKTANPTASMNSINAAAMRQLDVRPYLFCSDEHTEDDPTCNRFDRGITVEELTKSLIEEYETRYKLYGFRRGRRDFTGSSDSVIGRYIMPVRRLLDEYVYNIINDSFRTQDNFDGSPNPGSHSDYVGAINAGIDFYTKILETAEPGDYHVDLATGDLVSGKSEEDGAKNVKVDLSTGKYLDARVDVVGGRDEIVLNRGIELDKIGVLYAMGLRGYPALKYERAQLAVNYFDLIKELTVDLFSKVMREDLKTEIVSTLGEDGVYHPVTDPDFAFDEANPAHLKAKIRASTSPAVREYATIFATNFDNSGNRTFGDYVDYRLKGIDAVFPAGVTTAEFTSSSGLKTYVVANTADDLSISFKIASKAQETVAKMQAARDALATMPSSGQLKADVIAKFAEAWAIGNGEPIDQDTIDILTGNFEPNLPIVRLITDSFVAGTEDPDQLARITVIRDELFALIDQVEALAADKSTFESAIEDGQRDLTGFETDLIHLKDMYNIFK